MSIQIADISLAAAVVGTTGTITWDKIAPPPTLLQQMRPLDTSGPTIALFNESQCKLLITLPTTGQSFTLPAGRWVPIPVPANERSLTYVVTQIAPGTALFTQLSADYFRPGEPVHPIGTLGNSPIGGSVVSAAQYPQRVAQLNPPLNVTSVAAVAPLTYTTGTTTELLRITANLFGLNGTSPRNISMNYVYTEPEKIGVLLLVVTNSFLCSGQLSANTGMFSNGANNFTVAISSPGQAIQFHSQYFLAAAGTTVTLQFQDDGGTPNWFLSAVIERLG